jgi:WD40 repeat protein
MPTNRLVAVGALAASLFLAGCPNPISTFFENLGLVALSSIPRQAYELASSPDGTQIAFTSADGLFLTDTQGGPARKLASAEGIITAVGWSADGKAVLFMPTKQPPPTQPGEPQPVPGPAYEPGRLQAVDVATGTITPSVAVSWTVSRLMPSPDGRRLAIVGYGVAWIYDPDAGTTTNVAGVGPVQTLAWSPDGKYLAYLSAESASPAAIVAYDWAAGTSRRIEGVSINLIPERAESSCLTLEERLAWTTDGTGIQVVQHLTPSSFGVTTFGLDGQQRSDRTVELGNGDGSIVECFRPSPGGQYVMASEIGLHGIPVPAVGQVGVDLATGQVRRHSGEGTFWMWLGNSSRYVLRKPLSGNALYYVADVKG